MSKTRKVLFALCLLIAAVSVGYAVFYFTSRQSAQDIYDKLQPDVVTPSGHWSDTAQNDPEPEDPDTSDLPDVSGDPDPDTETDDHEMMDPAEPKTAEVPEFPITIDFDELKAINEDIFAWIEIPDTVISFPIVQHKYYDNYYLDHTIQHVSGFPGSIYTFAGVAKDFSQFNTLIYGHNMYNGKMFSNLYLFQNADYLAAHPEIYIYTPDRNYVYKIFAAVVYDDRLISASFDDTWEPDRQAYLDSLNNGNSGTLYLDDVPVTTQDHIITLSTCIRYHPDLRLLIVAVRTDGQEDGGRQTGLLDG